MIAIRKVVVAFGQVSTTVDGYELVTRSPYPTGLHIHLQLTGWELEAFWDLVNRLRRNHGRPFGADSIVKDVCRDETHDAILNYTLSSVALSLTPQRYAAIALKMIRERLDMEKR